MSERAAQLRPPFIDPVANSAAFLRDKKANISTVLNVNAVADNDVVDQVGKQASSVFEK